MIHCFGKKAFLGFIILMATLCLCFAATAETQSGTCGDNLTWTLDDNGVLTISGTGEMESFAFGWLVSILTGKLIDCAACHDGGSRFIEGSPFPLTVAVLILGGLHRPLPVQIQRLTFMLQGGSDL